MEIGAVRKVDIGDEVKRAYLDYAMSVIVSRALPDARDGLKPVQRRILYAMHTMGMRPGTAYKKSARIVGEVLGKYHPHSDTAVYEAMVRMAQDFSVRSLLVDGQGNFGSIDGDSPAAMRYTEARLAPVAMEILKDLGKETIDWNENFDGTLEEPQVLPANMPNLLVNGASGIAVGMSTNIPPHQLGEVVDALAYLLNNWERLDDVGLMDLMQFIQGPDFPTGGLVYRQKSADAPDALLKAYATGRGRITIRARAHVEDIRGGRERIVVTEIPYQVNKTTLIEKIAKLVRAGKIEGISDLRDESDRRGLRLVIDLGRGVDSDEMLRTLYAKTRLEIGYSIITLALVDGEPRLLSLKKALLVFLEHRLEVLRKRTNYELAHARERAHILAGLLIAIDNLDEVINTIRRSRQVRTARNNLQRQFNLSAAQAQAILDMPLKRLVALERKKLQKEHAELVKRIEELESLLQTPEKQRQIIRDELLAVKEKYADRRRTRILGVRGEEVVLEDLLPDELVWVVVTRGGRVGRLPNEDGKAPYIYSRPEDAPLAILQASTRDLLYLFTAEGTAVTLPVHQLPVGQAWEGGGGELSALTRLEDEELAGVRILPRAAPEGAFFFLTAQGQAKRLLPADAPGVGLAPAIIMRLEEHDWLAAVEWVQADDEVIIGSTAGQGIRFVAKEVRTMGAEAGGVIGIRLAVGDVVAGVAVVRPHVKLVTITDKGAAKRTELAEFPSQRRGGKGIQIAKLEPGERLRGLGMVLTTSHLIPVTQRGAAKTTTGRLSPEQGRATHGEVIIALQGEDRVRGMVIPQERIKEAQEEN
ncbi:MAG: DNA topoisomerase (ATP-hydrolyzing) subunit A [Chloroflexota bacterium]|nr:DNA topoisomerase (ATP-hydrolyzing) subunit A [Chloroflexota bacterium]